MSVLKVSTTLGAFTISLRPDRAPATCRYYLELATAGRLDNGTVFRITTGDGDDRNPIRVIQCGTHRGLDERWDSITHESTRDTGIRHRRWTVSAARFKAGVVYSSFFVCLRDEPALDFGGGRHDDGLGYAAFGEVCDGFETLEVVYAKAEPGELLSNPILMRSVEIISLAPNRMREEQR